VECETNKNQNGDYMVSDFGDYSCRLQRLYSRLKQRVYNATIRKCGQGFR